MQGSPTRPFLLRQWGLLLGLLLIAAGLLGVYYQRRARALPGTTKIVSGLLCKIYPVAAPPSPVTETSSPKSKKTSAAPVPPPVAPDLVTGAILKLSAPPNSPVNQTVVVNLCVEPSPGLSEQRQQALKDHLLVQLSAIGLQVDPREKIPVAASSPECLGTAAWTVRASAPGRYSAVLVPESTDNRPNRAPATLLPKPRWEFDLDQPAQLDIQFQDPWTATIKSLWASVSTLLGTILVITQIMLNLRQRKKTQAA